MSTTFDIGRVSLVVNDLALVRAYYEEALGLEVISSEGEVALLGAGGVGFFELRQDKHARRAGPREAGLFHTAFLLPERADLGRWTQYAIDRRLPVQGASDHLVSEAIYLADPEGNGIEIYVDRPRADWDWGNGEVAMATEALDVGNLLASSQGTRWSGAPAGTKVGHVHLQIGELTAAEAFYTKTLGMDLTARYPGGLFYALDGYHHHLATNTWSSRGAQPRDFPVTGLAEVELKIDAPRAQALLARAEATGNEVRDPWGNLFTITAV